MDLVNPSSGLTLAFTLTSVFDGLQQNQIKERMPLHSHSVVMGATSAGNTKMDQGHNTKLASRSFISPQALALAQVFVE